MRTVIVGLLCFLVMVPCVKHGFVQDAFAQSTTVAVETPAVIKIAAGTEAGLPIRLTPDNTVPSQSMVLIRGLPASVRLNHGRNFASGVWAVKPSVLEDLRVVAAPDIREDTHLVVSLVTLEGNYLSNVLARIVIVPPEVSAGTASDARQAPGSEDRSDATDVIPTLAIEPDERAAAGARPDDTASLTGEQQADPLDLTDQDVEKILKLMQKGDQYLFEGKIAAARRFYQYVAEMGWPDGAAAIGRTYDPQHLKKFSILGGIEPDPAKAGQWYAKARELGARIDVDALRKVGQR